VGTKRLADDWSVELEYELSSGSSEAMVWDLKERISPRKLVGSAWR